MKTGSIWIAALLVAMMFTTQGWCHGVEGYIDTVRAHCITALYDDGEPMSYAKVEVKAPDAKIVFQTGRTDRNGCFMVRADTPGDWRATVQDGMGHRLALNFSVTPEIDGKPAAPSPLSTANPSMSRPLKGGVALSIIFGLYGLLYGWRSRHLPKR
ncbi:MAG: carboxypeptidase regulatory-like domain-containing protein [Desulfatitalea sp.]|nr:carboxypeptidase-like regulatory domain-containing protein [Desulfatitalea sp.]NNK02705.1 carboxypeptidase regulatory-like domain-containing protein [Desulfatitalea sp.]